MGARLWAIVDDVDKIDVYHRIGKYENPAVDFSASETRKNIPAVSGGNIIAVDHVASGRENVLGDIDLLVRGSTDTSGTTGTNISASALQFDSTSKAMVAVEGVDLSDEYNNYFTGVERTSGGLDINTQWVRISYQTAPYTAGNGGGDEGGGDITQSRCVRPWWWCR